MAIRDVVTRGYVYGNAVSTRGYSISAAITTTATRLFTLPAMTVSHTAKRILSTSNIKAS